MDSIKKLVKHHVFKLRRAFLIVSLTNVPWLVIRSHALHDILKKIIRGNFSISLRPGEGRRNDECLM